MLLDPMHTDAISSASTGTGGPCTSKAMPASSRACSTGRLGERHSQAVACSKAGYHDADGWLRDFPIKPDQAEHLLGAGMTICAGFLPETGPLGSLLAGLRRDLLTPGKPYFNCYHSPDGHGFNLHIDDHPVLILQIEGTKAWRYSAVPGVVNPTRGFQFPPGRAAVKLPWGYFTRPEPDSLASVELGPGDVLYLPPGTWHEARARGSSLALTLAYERVSATAVMRDAIADRLEQLIEHATPAPVALADSEPDGALERRAGTAARSAA